MTTHIGDLKTYAFTNPRAENAAVEFDLETLRPRYRLHIGDIGQSNALQIARRLNLPEHLVSRAAKYIEGTQGETSRGERLETLDQGAQIRRGRTDHATTLAWTRGRLRHSRGSRGGSRLTAVMVSSASGVTMGRNERGDVHDRH